LVAIIAAVVLTLRRRQDVKHLDPTRQIAVKASDRLRVLQMPAEKEAE
jgi:NADH-quinone oxidoreductase subunit J